MNFSDHIEFATNEDGDWLWETTDRFDNTVTGTGGPFPTRHNALMNFLNVEIQERMNSVMERGYRLVEVKGVFDKKKVKPHQYIEYIGHDRHWTGEVFQVLTVEPHQIEGVLPNGDFFYIVPQTTPVMRVYPSKEESDETVAGDIYIPEALIDSVAHMLGKKGIAFFKSIKYRYGRVDTQVDVNGKTSDIRESEGPKVIQLMVRTGLCNGWNTIDLETNWVNVVNAVLDKYWDEVELV